MRDPETMHDATAPIPRYALYFSPSEATPLACLGNEWLGRDAATDVRSIPELPFEISQSEWSQSTDAPARYGFHATLKPPFRLAEGATLQDLQQAVRSFAARKEAFTVPHLVVGTLGHFLALILSENSETFSGFAADCVRDFDHFRAPASESETNRRMHGSLTQRECENLLRWGYPYVLDTWKFHMTLTCSLAEAPLKLFRRHLDRRFAEVCVEPIRIDSVGLYEEPQAGMPFRLLERFGLSL
jgi:putative phosphonate metabolism protein